MRSRRFRSIAETILGPLAEMIRRYAAHYAETGPDLSEVEKDIADARARAQDQPSPTVKVSQQELRHREPIPIRDRAG